MAGTAVLRGRKVYNSMLECARCSMVDVDPSTGTKGKTLRALADTGDEMGRSRSAFFSGTDK
jgi:hypothetical protein